ncbi:MAG: nucleotidyl transferase AbiEii/AbiGii toxin family protein [Bacteroidales bacterium]|jgi:predicted nucleotidyltransferase component of viral defense system|nr:nucleotidyl transferase AbiEii/AbiGii toxin family protein [Bacteroidales bacterium]MDY0370591.1 nucleotidyl transferase AbiEii/AbiGii toxin family protein [Bacteroidales bacterium]
MNHREFKNQAKLLINILPLVSNERIFALHGGTAINLFQLNMPRLSVDIDLTYLPLEDRNTSLKNIEQSLATLKQNIEKVYPQTKVTHNKLDSKLIVSNREAQIKVEVNQIKRACYEPPVLTPLCMNAQQEFDLYCEMQLVEIGHLFGGKICAALDRQHPRDLFDIRNMFATVRFSNTIKKGFLFYLISSNRPIAEILNPQFKDLRSVFETQFKGMTEEPFSYEEYETTRNRLIRTIRQSLTDEDKRFLLRIEMGEPDWSIYNFNEFPAVQWKLINIRQLADKDPKKYWDEIEQLKAVLL